jgi:hypothetical protein
MAVTTTWAVKIGYYNNGTTFTKTDLTSRTTGLTIDQFTNLGIVGTGTAAVTFDNNDGAMTPLAGGTFSNTDWMKHALMIEATITSPSGSETVQVFGGIIDDFDLYDDGVTSTVTLGAIDVVQTAGRQVVNFAYGSVDYSTARIATQALLEPISAENNTKMPNWGETAKPDGVLNVTSLSPEGRPVRLDADVAESGPVGDYMANAVATSGLTALWPNALDATTGHAELYIIENAKKNNVKSFVFAELPTTGEFPLRSLKRQYNVDQLTNAVQIARVGQTDTQTATGDTLGVYGPRVRIYQSGATTNANALEDGENWVKRFEYSRFAAERLVLTAAMIEQDVADADYDDWANLLNPKHGIWAGAKINYTPAGIVSEQVEYSVIIGRTIKASPSDTTVTLTLRPSIDYGTFTLDSSSLGIIGRNRLG